MSRQIDIAAALRKVSEDMSRQYHSTSIERAFKLLADELENQALGLDPLPFVWEREWAGGKHQPGDRVPWGTDRFYGAEVLSFAPREEYEQDIAVYKTRPVAFL